MTPIPSVSKKSNVLKALAVTCSLIFVPILLGAIAYYFNPIFHESTLSHSSTAASSAAVNRVMTVLTGSKSYQGSFTLGKTLKRPLVIFGLVFAGLFVLAAIGVSVWYGLKSQNDIPSGSGEGGNVAELETGSKDVPPASPGASGLGLGWIIGIAGTLFVGVLFVIVVCFVKKPTFFFKKSGSDAIRDIINSLNEKNFETTLLGSNSVKISIHMPNEIYTQELEEHNAQAGRGNLYFSDAVGGFLGGGGKIMSKSLNQGVILPNDDFDFYSSSDGLMYSLSINANGGNVHRVLSQVWYHIYEAHNDKQNLYDLIKNHPVNLLNLFYQLVDKYPNPPRTGAHFTIALINKSKQSVLIWSMGRNWAMLHDEKAKIKSFVGCPRNPRGFSGIFYGIAQPDVWDGKLVLQEYKIEKGDYLVIGNHDVMVSEGITLSKIATIGGSKENLGEFFSSNGRVLMKVRLS
jgi:hypothetical protein